MLEPDDGIPDGRCGFVLQPEHVEEDPDSFPYPLVIDVEDWVETVSLTTCIRETWSDGRCIWHADEADKPIGELLAARSDDPETLDGAVLEDIVWPDSASFDGCSLIGSRWSTARAYGATFEAADLRGADLQGAELVDAKFPHADLTAAEFDGADLKYAELPDVIALEAEFTDAELWRAEFPEADCHRADFSGADLGQTTFHDADMTSAEFVGAELRRAEIRESRLPSSKFYAACLVEATIAESNLQNANLARSELADARLPTSDLRGALLQRAHLRDAVLDETDLRQANLYGAELYQTVLVDVRIDDETNFGDRTPYRTPRFNTRIELGDEVATNPLRAAAWVNRRLEPLYEDNAMVEAASHYHIQKEEAERDLAHERAFDGYSVTSWENAGRWGVTTAMKYLTKHGESVKHVLGWWVIVIGVSALLFPWIGGIKDDSDEVYALTSLSELTSFAGWNEWGLNLYFSTITFSTIGYGDLSPASPLARLLVSIESIAGALLLALLVFVLGRRVAR